MAINRKTYAVGYKKQVSDGFIPLMLDAMAAVLASDIVVHSGDRQHRPKGSKSTSHHLDGRAADFHVVGMSDANAFAALMDAADKLPTIPDQRFQLIHHGPYTGTEAGHLHLGHYRALQKSALPWSIAFFVEGMVPKKQNVYDLIGHSSTKC